MAFTFTQLTSDTFHRANESPLNPAVWPQYFTPDIMEIVNNECVINLFPTNVTQDSDSANIAIDWKNTVPDQWIEFELKHFDLGSLDMYLRTDAVIRGETIPCYRFTANGPFNDNTGISGWTIDKIDITGGIIDYTWVDFRAQTFQSGDRIRFGVIGQADGHLVLYLNDVLLYTAALSDSIGHAPLLTSGIPGFQLASFGDPQQVTDIGVVNFKGGSMSGTLAYSIPDSRNYGNFPNDSREVQGTLTYDVPSVFSLRYWFNTLFNRTEPLPLDSRTAVPTDSRTSSPQNSRTTP